ncbi:MAG: flagellar FlbD family protein [Phycisphaerae bacterium]|nr:flagellar FlbD family protein [Phycisphaerae bacterium]
MIRLTRLNGRVFVLNAEHIKTIEETPDTTITLVNGEQFMVKEDLIVVVRRAIEYTRSVRTFRVE